MTSVQIPRKAVGAGEDILAPTTDLLIGLNLLGTQAELEKSSGFRAAFEGPADSVALIEAGGTALVKWWAAGLGVAVAGAWTAVATWWGDQVPSTRGVALWAAGIASAACVLSIGYIIGSDVRGRASAAVATISARSALAEAMLLNARLAFAPDPSPAEEQIVALPAPLPVRNLKLPAAQEGGWLAIALQSDGAGAMRFFVTKGSVHEWVDAAQIELV